MVGKNPIEARLRKKVMVNVKNRFKKIIKSVDLNEAIVNDNYLSKIMSDQKRKPVLIIGGSKTHSMGYILFENRLYVCNKGASARDQGDAEGPQLTKKVRAIVPYSIKDDDSSRNLLKSLLIDKSKFEKAKDVYDKIDGVLSESEDTPFNFNPKQNAQRIGNCWLLSPLTTIYALSILSFKAELSKMSEYKKSQFKKHYHHEIETDNELAARLGRSFYKDHLSKKHMIAVLANEMSQSQWDKFVIEFAMKVEVAPDKMRRLKSARN